MGGEIGVEDSALGGARFVFTWRSQASVPAANSPVASAPASATERLQRSSPPDRALRILVAEDNPVNTLVAKKVLEMLGYEAEFVTDGFGAVAAVESNAFDVVLMDVSMPGMDGMAASRAIRERGDAVHQPRIVALTANAMPGDREASLAAGMDDHLAKPIDRVALAQMLAAVHAAVAD